MREGIIIAMITHSQMFFLLCFSTTHVWGGCAVVCPSLCCTYLLWLRTLHFPAACGHQLEAVTSVLVLTAGSTALVGFAGASPNCLTQIKKHSCDPCSRQSWWGHRQRSNSRVLEGRSLHLAQPCCSLIFASDLILVSKEHAASFGFDFAMFNLQG